MEMLGRGDDDGVDGRILQKLVVILERFGSFAVLRLDQVPRLGQIAFIGVAHGYHVRPGLVPACEITAGSGPDPGDIHSIVGSHDRDRRRSGRNYCARRLEQASAGQIDLDVHKFQVIASACPDAFYSQARTTLAALPVSMTSKASWYLENGK